MRQSWLGPVSLERFRGGCCAVGVVVCVREDAEYEWFGVGYLRRMRMRNQLLMRRLIADMSSRKPSMRRTATWGVRIGTWILLCLVARQASAQALTTLFNFSGANGSNPWGTLVLSGSTFYGNTTAGGSSNGGTVFSFPVAGASPTTLASLNNSTGWDPLSSLSLAGSSRGCGRVDPRGARAPRGAP